MTREICIAKEKLKNLYVNQKLSSRQIAYVFGCYHSTILSKLRKYSIAARQTKRFDIDKNELEKLYSKKKLSTYQIAKLLGCKAPTVLRRLNRFGIKIRKTSKFSIIKKDLEKYYLKDNLSISKISKKLGCSPTVVYRRLLKYKIPMKEGWHEVYPKSNFNGNKKEIAYMLGFRYGDLNAEKDSDRIITIKCGTTKEEQINLIKTVFGTYGHFWVGDPDKQGRRQVEVNLNATFDFLLSKKENIPNWIRANDVLFWNFFSGYFDAEGTIGVYDGRARVRIGSYDKLILQSFSNILKGRFEINNRFKLEAKKRNGRNGDFWRVSVNDKEAILKLFGYIKPMIKHSKRLNDLIKAEANVIQRMEGDKIN